jgi:hypothetical protein
MGKHSRKNHQGRNYLRGGEFAWYMSLRSTVSGGRVHRDEFDRTGELSRQLLRQGLRREVWSQSRENGHGPRQHNDEFGPMPRKLRRAISHAKFKLYWRERQRRTGASYAPQVVAPSEVSKFTRLS